MQMGFMNSSNKISSTCVVPVEFTHSYASGQTGCGKTTGFVYPKKKELKIIMEFYFMIIKEKNIQQLNILPINIIDQMMLLKQVKIGVAVLIQLNI